VHGARGAGTVGGGTVGAGALEVLARVRRRRAAPRPGASCDLCAADIADDHPHVVDLDDRSLRCACPACGLLFTAPGAAAGRFRTVPDHYRRVEGFVLAPGQWEELQVPVSVAFFFHNSRRREVCAFYPGPAGATESLLPLDAWAGIVAANPALSTLEPDVEALLVRTSGGPEGYRVPVDACYELVGRLRRTWKGFDGGAEARAELDGFFARARERAGG
jgi:hypothetical protein